MEMTLEEIGKLKKMLDLQEQAKLDEYQDKKILGFTLSKGSTTSRAGKIYTVWRAHACKNGQKAILHVGKDPRNAEKKIKEYLKKHPKFRL